MDKFRDDLDNVKDGQDIVRDDLDKVQQDIDDQDKIGVEKGKLVIITIKLRMKTVQYVDTTDNNN